MALPKGRNDVDQVGQEARGSRRITGGVMALYCKHRAPHIIDAIA